MPRFHAVLVALFLSLPGMADEAADQAKSTAEVERKIAEIERLGATLKPGDSKERVKELLGNSTSMAAGYWSAHVKPVQPCWWYHFWPTKDHLVTISVQFDTGYRFKKLARKDTRAEEYTKLPLVEMKGIVENVYSTEENKLLQCQIKLPNQMGIYPVFTERMDKVHGWPRVGSAIVVQTYGTVSPHCFIFREEWLLKLHSITFKDAPVGK